MLKKDNYRFGLLLGFIAPILGMASYYFINFFPTYSAADFFSVLKQQPSLISGVTILSLFVNVLFLTLFLNKRKDKTAIGIFISACIYGVLSLLLKWYFS